MRITRVYALVKTAFAFSLLWGPNACVLHGCLHTAFAFFFVSRIAFSLVWRQSICVVHASLHRLRQLLRFLWKWSQCMRFKCVSTSVKTALAFSFVWRYNAGVSRACLHRLRRLLRFPWYGVIMDTFGRRVCLG